MDNTAIHHHNAATFMYPQSRGVATFADASRDLYFDLKKIYMQFS